MDQPSMDINTPEGTKRLRALLDGLHKTPALQQQEGLPSASEVSPVRGGKKAGPDLKASLARVLETNKADVPRPLDRATEQINIEKNDILKQLAELKLQLERAVASGLGTAHLEGSIDYWLRKLSDLSSRTMRDPDPQNDEKIIQQFMSDLRSKEPEETKESPEDEIPTLNNIVHIESETKETPTPPSLEQHEKNVEVRAQEVTIRQEEISGNTKDGVLSAKEESSELEKEAESLRIEQEKIEATKLANRIPESSPEEEAEFKRLEALRNTPPPKPGNPIPSIFEAAIARTAERNAHKEVVSEPIAPVTESVSLQNERKDAALLEMRKGINRINEISDKWAKRSAELSNEELVLPTEATKEKTEELLADLEQTQTSSLTREIIPKEAEVAIVPLISPEVPVTNLTPENSTKKLEVANAKINELSSELLRRALKVPEPARDRVRTIGRWCQKNLTESHELFLKLFASTPSIKEKLNNVTWTQTATSGILLGSVLTILIATDHEKETSAIGVSFKGSPVLSQGTQSGFKTPEAITWKITAGPGAPRTEIIVPKPPKVLSSLDTREAPTPHAPQASQPKAPQGTGIKWGPDGPMFDLETPKISTPIPNPKSNAFGANLLQTPTDTMRTLTNQARAPLSGAVKIAIEAPQYSPEILKQAEEAISNDLDSLFPKEGFWGESGIKTDHWQDHKSGFREKTVNEVLTTTSFPVSSTNSRRFFGIESPELTLKIQAYLRNIALMTRVAPNAGEKVGDYMKRAAISAVAKQRSLATTKS